MRPSGLCRVRVRRMDSGPTPPQSSLIDPAPATQATTSEAVYCRAHCWREGKGGWGCGEANEPVSQQHHHIMLLEMEGVLD